MSVSRPPLVAGNWKMNTGVEQGLALGREVVAAVRGTAGVEVAVLPPFTHLWPMRDVLQGSDVLLGAQDVFWEDTGAFTGEVSPQMLAGWCPLVLVGHSERRHLLGERDEQVGLKFARAHAHSLRTIVAVGETEDERDAGRVFEVVDRQLDAAFTPFDQPPGLESFVIAYEPVWAIGTGRTATPEQAQEMCAHIRAHLAYRWNIEAAQVLYGGSVTAANAESLFAQADIEGALVGGASLRAGEFGDIVEAAGVAARKQTAGGTLSQ
ncbi:MAG TPA: triose-phosphate isomerase [Candidatus Dormibacteraeota bacterium]|nr:triose-phosphate isomerase [Candidatus Dormibacteraeota bacterium]